MPPHAECQPAEAGCLINNLVFIFIGAPASLGAKTMLGCLTLRGLVINPSGGLAALLSWKGFFYANDNNVCSRLGYGPWLLFCNFVHPTHRTVHYMQQYQPVIESWTLNCRYRIVNGNEFNDLKSRSKLKIWPFRSLFTPSPNWPKQ